MSLAVPNTCRLKIALNTEIFLKQLNENICCKLFVRKTHGDTNYYEYVRTMYEFVGNHAE